MNRGEDPAFDALVIRVLIPIKDYDKVNICANELSILILSSKNDNQDSYEQSVNSYDNIRSEEYETLISAVDRLRLNDSSVTVVKDQSSSLGSGLRIGFLGFLHMEVFNQRLNDEFNVYKYIQ